MVSRDPSSPGGAVRQALEKGEVTLQGQFVLGSNYTFLVTVEYEGQKLEAVYKPMRGEQPLWDFPPASLAGREVRLSPEQYARLVAYVRDSFARTADGRPIRLGAPGYFDTDAFYAAKPRYTFWMTSNEWVRRGLTVAGVRTPVWAPFDSALFFQLRSL